MNKLTRLEKCEIAISRGYTYNEETGFIYSGKHNKRVIRKSHGYISINFMVNGKSYNLLGHQFAWYFMHKEIVEEIDHKNGIKSDNRRINLRSVTRVQNTFNLTSAKGYSLNKNNRFHSSIKLNNKTIYLGTFDTDIEARNAYLEAKKIYHKID